MRALSRLESLAALDAVLQESMQHDPGVGILLLRLLRTRETNILFGYELGQRMIEAAATAIEAGLRPVDALVQTGEAEFVMLLPNLMSPNHAVLAAHRIVREFQRPLEVEGQAMLAAVAVGIALAPDHGTTAEALCRRADIAFGEARRNGTHVAMYAPIEQLFDIPYGELRSALEAGQLEVHLQPILDFAQGRIVGAESLARWNSPTLGPIAPDVFVPLAERTGLIGELTRWSLNASLRNAALAGFAQRGLHVSINVSPRVFLDRSFGEQMISALRLWDVPARSVVVEVTEGAMMEDPEHGATVLGQLRDAGLSIAVDDFGTGYSSFSYLRRFPANEVKIDQSFIFEVADNPRSALLVRSMIELAHRLGMRVVAEGVEDAATLDLLREMGCDLAQGFHIGRPCPASAFAASL